MAHAYLHQAVANLISAGQRLLPLGQSEAGRILWTLKGDLMRIAEESRTLTPGGDRIACFTPLVDMAAMRHPTLPTRLFIS